MIKQIIAMLVIFVCATIAWFALGESTMERTHYSDSRLRSEVGELWGVPQEQKEPGAVIYSYHPRMVERTENKKTIKETVIDKLQQTVTLESSDIAVKFDLDYRKKGLLWYSSYKVGFKARYTIQNDVPKSGDLDFSYIFPSAGCIYDDFRLAVNGKEVQNIAPVENRVVINVPTKQGEKTVIEISYNSQGLDSWYYTFSGSVSQIKNFNMKMTTNFDGIDFPGNSVSPTDKKKIPGGWELAWRYKNLISGIRIGMEMPQKLNPGPFVSEISHFAPVSLFIFLFLMFVITAIRGIKIHPVNYFFISASFFSFHLLMAYLVDHMAIQASFFISAAVSIGLVVSYMRLVVGGRFAILETGLSQLVYLVLFSYTFFFEGYTGLIITVLCIITLFIVMQLTGRTDWGKIFEGGNGRKKGFDQVPAPDDLPDVK